MADPQMDNNFQNFLDLNGIANVSYGTQKDTRTKTLRANFGDGYGQRGASGINDLTDNWSLVWEALPIEHINWLEFYFRSLKGYKSFSWSPVRAETEAPKRFICNEWSRGFLNDTHDNFIAKFEEVFDIA